VKQLYLTNLSSIVFKRCSKLNSAFYQWSVYYRKDLITLCKVLILDSISVIVSFFFKSRVLQDVWFVFTLTIYILNSRLTPAVSSFAIRGRFQSFTISSVTCNGFRYEFDDSKTKPEKKDYRSQQQESRLPGILSWRFSALVWVWFNFYPYIFIWFINRHLQYFDRNFIIEISLLLIDSHISGPGSCTG